MRKNLSSKCAARQLASRFDDLSRANYEEALFLFADQDEDAQLELPIKIDTLSQRPRRHSDSFSEDPQRTPSPMQSISSARKSPPPETARKTYPSKAHTTPLKNYSCLWSREA
jgi:hypothetical protein